MIYCELSDLHNESDVEQKLIYPILSDIRGCRYFPPEIKTKGQLSPTDIDKGTAKKIGYYPDYVIVLAGIPVLVIEAKSPTEKCIKGWNEAKLYAHHLNSNYDSGLNPCAYVISCNGSEILHGSWDTNTPDALPFNEVFDGSASYQNLLKNCRRDILIERLKRIRSAILPNRRWRPLSLLGGTSLQKSELPPNQFARDLVPILRKYFNAENDRTPYEVIEKGYVTTEERTKYVSVLESLLSDNITRVKFPGIEDVKTNRSKSNNFSNALANMQCDDKSLAPLLLLLGGVGSGKSTFIDRYFGFLQSDDKRDNLWVVLDFNHITIDEERLTDWIFKTALEDFEARNQIANFDLNENLIKYFARSINTKKRRRYSAGKCTDIQLEEIQREEIDRITESSEEFFLCVARYFQEDCHKPLIVVFDNVDRRDADFQLKVFETIQYFRAKVGSFCILTMRDDTFDRYKNEPPLDAFLNPFTFRVAPPRFIDVAKKRLELILENLSQEVPENLEFQLETGIKIRYPNSHLGKFLFEVYRSLFNPSRKIRLILESLAGRDVRKALAMFSEILISGYFDEFNILRADENTRIDLKEWQVIQILMKTKHRFFFDGSGYIHNMFNVPDENRPQNNFLIPTLLIWLNSKRKDKGPLGIEGYQSVKMLIAILNDKGFLREDIEWALEYLLRKQMIICDNFSASMVDHNGSVKISPSGFIHLTLLSIRSQYIGNVAMDTHLPSKEYANEIKDRIHPPKRFLEGSFQRRRIQVFIKTLDEELQRLREISLRFDDELGGRITDKMNELHLAYQRDEEHRLKQSELKFSKKTTALRPD